MGKPLGEAAAPGGAAQGTGGQAAGSTAGRARQERQQELELPTAPLCLCLYHTSQQLLFFSFAPPLHWLCFGLCPLLPAPGPAGKSKQGGVCGSFTIKDLKGVLLKVCGVSWATWPPQTVPERWMCQAHLLRVSKGLQPSQESFHKHKGRPGSSASSGQKVNSLPALRTLDTALAFLSCRSFYNPKSH